MTVRLSMILLLAAFLAGCAGNQATTGAPLEPGDDPYFDCHNAAFVRRHIDVCSGIVR